MKDVFQRSDSYQMDASSEQTASVSQILDVSPDDFQNGSGLQVEDQLRIFLKYTPSPIVVFDKEMRFLFANQKWFSDFKIKDENLAGKTNDEIFPHLKGKYDHILQHCLQGNTEKSEEEPLVQNDGTVDWIRWEIHPWRKSPTEIGGLIIFVEIITNEKKIRDERDRLFLLSLDSLVVAGVDGFFRDINPAFQQTLGFTREELMSRPFMEIVFPEDREATMNEVLKLQQGVPTTYFEHRCICKDGSFRWMAWTASPFAEQGIFYAFGRDITDRKRAEEILQRERDLMGAFMQNVPDMIYFKDTQSRFLKCSASMAKRFNMNHPDELIGMSDWDFFDSENAQSTFDTEKEIMETKQPLLGVQTKEVWADNRITWAIVSKLPLMDIEGNVIGTFGISKDITALKEAETELDLAHKQLVKTSRMAGMAEVATGVLHNVGNVLNSVNVSATIIGEHIKNLRIASLDKASDLLSQNMQQLESFLTQNPRGVKLPTFFKQLSEHFHTQQDKILAETESLKKNIEHIKQIVSMQQGYVRVTRNMEKINAVSLIEDALQVNADLLSTRIRIEQEFEPDVFVTTDRHKVVQILINLIRNACHAIHEKGVDGKLSLKIVSSDSRVKISVQDDGVGISPENLSKIFGHGFTTKSSGHGFGLHSSALAAREMGGILSVESPGLGQGSTFTLELPESKEASATT